MVWQETVYHLVTCFRTLYLEGTQAPVYVLQEQP